MFLFCSKQRITIPEIKKHPWFIKNMPADFVEDGESSLKTNTPSQSIEEVISIIQEARKGTLVGKKDGQFVGGSIELDDEIDSDDELEDDIDTFVCAM